MKSFYLPHKSTGKLLGLFCDFLIHIFLWCTPVNRNISANKPISFHLRSREMTQNYLVQFDFIKTLNCAVSMRTGEIVSIGTENI